MFWRIGHTQSAIDAVLDRDDFTIEEVLDEEEVLQECKAHNRKLIEFLTKHETLETLLNFIIEKPSDDVDETLKYRYSCLAAEVFGCEILAICDTMVRSETLLPKLWKFLDNPAPLNPIQGSYFCKIFSVLLSKKTVETVKFIQAQEKPISKLLEHIGTAAFMDLFLKLISMEENKEAEGILQWVLDKGLVPKCLDKFDPVFPEPVYSNTSQLLIGLLNVVQALSPRNAVLEQLKSGSVICKLFEHLAKPEAINTPPLILAGFTILTEIVQRALGFVREGDLQMYLQGMEVHEEDLTEFMAALLPHLPAYFNIILNIKPSLQPSPESTERPAVGIVRLKLVEFFIVLFHANNASVNKKILELNFVPLAIDLFFKFPWNNFLHALVHDVVFKIFLGELHGAHELMLNALKEGRLTEKIVEASKLNDSEIEERKGVRRGYMGHLILISNHLIRYSQLPDAHDDVVKILDMEYWKDFEKLTLAVTNKRDNKPLGGARPMVAQANAQPHSYSTTEGDASADQFARFLCHQITADLPEKFGEEEDEDFEMDEEVLERPNFGAAGAYTDRSPRHMAEFDDSDEEMESPQGETWSNHEEPTTRRHYLDDEETSSYSSRNGSQHEYSRDSFD